jgi:hypothetical protein
MAALLAAPPPLSSSLTLYQIEETLAALAETAEVVPPEQEEEFLQEFAAVLQQTVEKRDRMGQFLAHLETQIGLANAETKRLQQRRQSYERVLAQTEEYLVRTIQLLGTDSKGRYKKLEGNTVTFSLRACPPSVDVINESEIPTEFKTATITIKIPASQWEGLLDKLDLESRAQFLDCGQVEYTPSKTRIKAALDAGQAVPGAGMAPRSYSLVRR